jgi:hypothetical protein
MAQKESLVDQPKKSEIPGKDKFEYAEAFLVKLRNQYAKYTKLNTITVGKIIGIHSGNQATSTPCAICGVKGTARISQNGRAWVGEACCRSTLSSSWPYKGHVNCLGCNSANKQGHRKNNQNNSYGVCNDCNAKGGKANNDAEVENMQLLIDSELKIVRSEKAKLKKTKQTNDEKAKPYIDAGLAEPFALAIARGTDSEQVLNLWESKWWKQYPADDILIVSVLKGELTEDEARDINEFRGEHLELAMACIQKSVTVEWATMLLDAGFEEHSDAVRNVLSGADPVVIARIRQMKVDKDAIPPPLLQPLLGNTRADEKAKGKQVSWDAELDFMNTQMSEKHWEELFSTFLQGSTDHQQTRIILQNIYTHGRDWVNTSDSKKSLETWARLFHIKERSRMNKQQLVKEVRLAGSRIRAFVRTQLP